VNLSAIDVAIVGGGLAGTWAAIAAAEAGAQSVLFDERPVLQSDLAERATAAGVDLRPGRLVWAIFGGRRLAVLGELDAVDVSTKSVILATGSVTISEPSPGWTQPEIRLALMAECASGYSPPLGGWVPGRSRYLETSTPGLFVAGDGGGICPTPDVAAAEGRLAGTSAAALLGFGTAAAREDAAQDLERVAPGRLAEIAAIDAWYVQGSHAGIPAVESYSDTSPEAGPAIDDEQAGSMVCPCEAVRASAIQAAIAQGARSLNDVKRRTRAGMGVCQGVQCGHPIRTMICEQTGIDPAQIPPMTSRPPARLLRLADLAGTR
jgi:bacterioferritin-associated ferredoxin